MGGNTEILTGRGLQMITYNYLLTIRLVFMEFRETLLNIGE